MDVPIGIRCHRLVVCHGLKKPKSSIRVTCPHETNKSKASNIRIQYCTAGVPLRTAYSVILSRIQGHAMSG